MLDRIPMHIAQPSQVTVLVREASVAEIVPDVSSRLPVNLVQLARRVIVEVMQEHAQVGCPRVAARDEVIVVGQHRPGLQLPAAPFGH